MKRLLRFLSFGFCLLCLTAYAQPQAKHNLQFDRLAQRWDEAMPLGNGMLGALVWEKQGNLRLSLDRADLWDLRPLAELSKFNFKDVERWVLNNQYDSAHKLGDAVSKAYPYPTKLPAAAIEFDLSSLGQVVSNTLDIKTALNTVRFETGVVFNCYIHATQNVGYFAFEHLPEEKLEALMQSLTPNLIVHNYNGGTSENDNSHAGDGLAKLGYAKGTVTKLDNNITYRQPTFEGHFYEVKIQWKKGADNTLIGSWVIENNKPATQALINLTQKEPTGWDTHIAWWESFWARSAISIPDELVEKQYYLEMYKLGAASRPAAPAITLQAVWTADNGSLPPWKGDFHNDLNTQLSYWPIYTGNHLKEGESYINWLWNNKTNNQRFTKAYFGVEGLNVPGVATLTGDPMGGWIQYSLGPTVGAWCAQYFYWQWKYAMDDTFLQQKAYPYITEVATYLDNITRVKNAVRKLPLSSSPEYNDNRIDAWFTEWSNFDLALVKFLFTAAIEVANATGKTSEAAHWQQILQQLPDYEVNETGFTIAPGQNLEASHRHMSQYMAIYPLALLDYNKPADKKIMDASFKQLELKGTRSWVGYSFSWMACLYARACKADSALKHLQIFASNFCSPNSFHLNGDQKGGEYSNFRYRPFTLEGNFAFAQGVHELLLQSRLGYIQVFPAVPASWKNVSFRNLRTEGAFIVSAEKVNGVPSTVSITAEKGGMLRIKLPFKTWICKSIPMTAFNTNEEGIVSVNLQNGQQVVFENGYE